MQNGTDHVDSAGAPVAPKNVIVQFTPYTAGAGSVGQNPALNGVAEPAGCAVVAGDCESNVDLQFVRRGYAFAQVRPAGQRDPATGTMAANSA